MAYIALKPCGFAGQRFKIGETIPAELIQPGAAKNLVKMEVIAATGDDLPGKAPVQAAPTIKPHTAIAVTINTKEGALPLELTPEGLQSVFDALTGNASTAEGIVAEMTDQDALILLNATDSRKTIKAATEERAAALLEPEIDDESEEIEEEEESLDEEE